MQTITFNDTNISAYIFEDDHNLKFIETGYGISCPHFIIGDMNSRNATIHTGVTSPEDWQGGKYLFDGTNWTLNDNWTDPNIREIEEREARLAELKS